MYISSVGRVGRLFCVSFFWVFFCQNATAWRCFTLSKQPVPVACEAPQQAGDLTPVSSSSVMNHVMHGSYGEVGLCRNASAPSSVVRRETFVFEVLQSNNLSRLNQPMFQCPYFVLPSLDNFAFAIVSESREPHGVGSLQGSSKVHLFR